MVLVVIFLLLNFVKIDVSRMCPLMDTDGSYIFLLFGRSYRPSKEVNIAGAFRRGVVKKWMSSEGVHRSMISLKSFLTFYRP